MTASPLAEHNVFDPLEHANRKKINLNLKVTNIRPSELVRFTFVLERGKKKQKGAPYDDSSSCKLIHSGATTIPSAKICLGPDTGITSILINLVIQNLSERPTRDSASGQLFD